MSVIATKSIHPDFIKIKWLEPYTSAALNTKSFKTLPRGIYRGFVVKAGPSPLEVTVYSDHPDGWDHTASGYCSGAFDAASGWSVAVHESMDGYSTTIAIKSAVSGMVSGFDTNFTFDLTGHAGSSVFLALDVQYQIGYPTSAQVKVIEAADLDNDPTKMVLARVDVPLSGSINDINIVYTDPNYPRILPYANRLKAGFMSKQQADIVETLSIPNASNAYEVVTSASGYGPQIVQIPGGNSYVINGNDLFVFYNGNKIVRGASEDYTEIDDGGGFGTSILLNIPEATPDAKIVFRGQQYAVSLTNTLSVLDENSLIQTNVTKVNFVGSGVFVTPDGLGAVKVNVTGGGGGVSQRSKKNGSGSTLLKGRAVHVNTNGELVPCDPTNVLHKLYGITAQAISNGGFGNIYIDGVASDTISGMGFAVGDDIFVSHVGDGSLTNVPPSPLSGYVYRVGFADCEDGVASSTATDIIFDRGRLT